LKRNIKHGEIAQAMAEELESDLVPVGQVQPSILVTYDLIGFGSGIYYLNLNKNLLEFVKSCRLSQENELLFSLPAVERKWRDIPP
jgi:menaquinone-dependent protoporphyrinogen IX oxidase